MRRCAEQKVVDIDQGRKIAYNQWPGEGRPIVALHGLLDSAEGWDLLASDINAPVYALDLPGFGRSDLPKHAKISSYAADIQQAIERISIADYILVGHSLGGAVATEIAAAQKENINHLLLLAPASFESIPLANFAAAPGPQQIISFLSPWLLSNKFIFNTTYQHFISNHCQPREELRERILQGAPNAAAGASRALRALSRAVKQEANDYKGPVTVLWGDKDKLVPLRHSQKVKETFPQTQLHILPDTGHHPQHEQPELVKELIETILANPLSKQMLV